MKGFVTVQCKKVPIVEVETVKKREVFSEEQEEFKE